MSQPAIYTQNYKNMLTGEIACCSYHLDRESAIKFRDSYVANFIEETDLMIEPDGDPFDDYLYERHASVYGDLREAKAEGKFGIAL